MTERRTEPAYFYYAVRRQGASFTETLDGTARGLSRPRYPDLRSYIARHYDRAQAEVTLRGRRFVTTVYQPRDVDDACYVVADDNGNPFGVAPSVAPDYTEFHDYFEALRKNVSYTEAIYPEQSCFLPTQFIAPTLHELRHDGARESMQPWGALANLSRVVVMGDAGAGKTTSLRRFILELVHSAASSRQVNVVPVYVPLRLVSKQKDVTQLIHQAALEYGGEQISSRMDDLASSGQLLLVFDGLDEVPAEARGRIADSISDVIRRRPLLRVFISTRRAHYDWRFSDFTHFELRAFSESQVKEWSVKKLQDRKRFQRFYTAVTESGELAALIVNPLMLSIATTLYLRNGITPLETTRVYDACVRTLIDHWDAVRGVTRSTERWAAAHNKYNVLARTAARLRDQNRASFTVEQFCAWEESHSDSCGTYEILEALREHTSLLSRDAAEYQFRTRELGEFMAALHLTQRTDSVTREVLNGVTERDGELVWAAVCALTPDATELARSVLQSDAVTPERKSLLLLELFRQAASTEVTVAAAAATFIVNQLDLALSGLKVDWTDPSERKRPRTNFVLTIEPEFDGGAYDPAVIERLLLSLRRARYSAARRAIASALDASPSTKIQQLRKLLEAEGQFVVTQRSPGLSFALIDQTFETYGQDQP